MVTVDPNTTFPGTVMIVAPHMDDEALACGALIARLSPKERIHIVYATDGMKSPAPIFPGSDAITPDLGEIRVRESTAAMTFLGVPQGNLRFLRLPEAQLKRNISKLSDMLMRAVREIQPDYILIPFRYDRHPDHLAINRVVTEGLRQGRYQCQIVEYFVYHRWRLLPKRDVRAYIKPECMLAVDGTDVAGMKRKALDFFKSQTEIYYPWQTRPILTSVLLDEESQNPEYFLFHQPEQPGTSVFTGSVLWIRLAHRAEPFLQKWKYLTGAYLKRAMQKYARNAR